MSFFALVSKYSAHEVGLWLKQLVFGFFKKHAKEKSGFVFL